MKRDPTADAVAATDGVEATLMQTGEEITATVTLKPDSVSYSDILHITELIRASIHDVQKDVAEGRQEQREAERRREEDARQFTQKLETLQTTMLEKHAAFSERLARVEGAVAAGESRRAEGQTRAGWLWNLLAAMLGGILAIVGQAILELVKKK